MIRILIVDDEQSIRHTLSRFLLKVGYQVDVAENAMMAKQMFESDPYDIVVTDIVMPKMTGIELMEFIRLTDTKCRILIMTGEATVETAARAVAAGAHGYLNKPILKEAFLACIETNVHAVESNKQKEKIDFQKDQYRNLLENTVVENTETLKRSMSSIIHLLSDVTEYRDPYTSGHQRRVGNLACAISRKLNFTTEFSNMVRAIGYIHDIGKIVVPSEILTKPGKLNEIEYKLIQMHAQSGFDMLQHVILPKNFSIAVVQHHERLDGSGYPNRLKSDDILFEAHILIVADVVETMMTHRPYRPALGVDKAIEEISTYRNRKYHPEVVDACIDLFRQDQYTLDDSLGEIHIPL
ncbi:MAG: response regulator [Erysipelotrichaceae bacterium]|nr:response regulator [Erysipelotrichaceae bacterium]MDP3306410.1 response regulator [Erysipelotrichaceae bacterium]